MACIFSLKKTELVFFFLIMNLIIMMPGGFEMGDYTFCFWLSRFNVLTSSTSAFDMNAILAYMH